MADMLTESEVMALAAEVRLSLADAVHILAALGDGQPIETPAGWRRAWSRAAVERIIRERRKAVAGWRP